MLALRNVRFDDCNVTFWFKPKTLELEGKKNNYITVQWGDYEEDVLMNERDMDVSTCIWWGILYLFTVRFLLYDKTLYCQTGCYKACFVLIFKIIINLIRQFVNNFNTCRNFYRTVISFQQMKKLLSFIVWDSVSVASVLSVWEKTLFFFTSIAFQNMQFKSMYYFMDQK